jgi:hypothetical protein
MDVIVAMFVLGVAVMAIDSLPRSTRAVVGLACGFAVGLVLLAVRIANGSG